MMKKVLVAVDFSKNTGRIVDQAIALAKGLNARLWIVHVTNALCAVDYEPMQFYDFAPEFISSPAGNVEMAREICADEYKREHHMLLQFSAKSRDNGVDAQAMLLKGSAAATILEKAEDLDVDLIVMGSHGHGLLRKVLLGSVTEAVLRQAFCSVLIVPSSQMPD